MMDFYQIKEKSVKNGVLEIYPDFQICRSNDLMTRGKAFYAIWDDEKKLWSTDEYDVQRLVDKELLKHRDKIIKKHDGVVRVKLMSDFSTKSWAEFRKYLSHISDNYKQLDNKLAFQNIDYKKRDYISKKLNYSLEDGKRDSYEKIIGTLYTPEEREKIEWSVGSIIAGDGKSIQKFLVLYGEAGAESLQY
jgi:hypothetical protein